MNASSQRAFTLVELLVVIGIIALLVGGTGWALGGRAGEGAALANAQALVSGLVSATRAQAALHQTTARLIVYAQPPPGANVDAAKYLRMLQVVRQETAANGATVWVAAGSPVLLPAPVCVVPPAPVPATHLRAGVAWNNNAATGPVSTLAASNSFNYRGQSTASGTQFFGVSGQNGRILHLDFSADGSVVSGSSGNAPKIALATAVLASNAPPQFNNAAGVRGLFVRRSGAVSLVNSASGF